jgi:hypothetical protein
MLFGATLLASSLFLCSHHSYPGKRDECDLLSLDLCELVCWSVLYFNVQTIVYPEKEMNVTYFPLISLSWSAGPFFISLFRPKAGQS